MTPTLICAACGFYFHLYYLPSVIILGISPRESMDKENKKRKVVKRRLKNCGETLKQSEHSGETDDEIIQPPKRRSARLIAISKPNAPTSDGMPKLTKGAGDGTGVGRLKQKVSDGSSAPSDDFTSSSFLSAFRSHLTSVAQPEHLSSADRTVFSDRPLTNKATNAHNAHSLGEGTSRMCLPTSSDDEGEEDEWGAMELLHTNKADKKVIEVQLDEKHSDLFKLRMNPLEERDAKEAKERAKWEHEIELELKRKRRELQAFQGAMRDIIPKNTMKVLEDFHRVHFLTFMAHLRFMADSLLRNSATFLKQITALFGSMSAPFTPVQMGQFLKEFRGKFCCQSETMLIKEPSEWCTREDKIVRHLLALFDLSAFGTDREIALLFFMHCSFLMKLRARICVAFNPMPKLLIEPKAVSKESEKKNNKKKGKQKPTEANERDGIISEDQIEYKRRRTKQTETKAEVSGGGGAADNGTAYWNEYWDEVERRWICVDPFHCRVDEPNQIESNFGFSVDGTHKILYVLAIDSERGIREIGAKYVGDYLSSANRKLRTDDVWIRQTMELEHFRANENCCRLEEAQIYEHLKSKPRPTVMAEFKNHPLYALKKDLLKFEAIYPPDIQPIGHIGKQKHEIFPRSAVHKLEGSLNWIKESRSIKAGEVPYKVVSARPKLNIPKEKREPLTLDLFGYWQTEPYVPPEVMADGRIPRNEFGNIYMYKEEMLPKGCVHLRLPGIYLIARRMDLEAVPAVVGWEFSGGFNHPILDGCVVLRKDEEVLRSAWAEMAREKATKTAKRAEERVWKNWRKLIRGKTLLEQMRTKFNST